MCIFGGVEYRIHVCMYASDLEEFKKLAYQRREWEGPSSLLTIVVDHMIFRAGLKTCLWAMNLSAEHEDYSVYI